MHAMINKETKKDGPLEHATKKKKVGERADRHKGKEVELLVGGDGRSCCSWSLKDGRWRVVELGGERGGGRPAVKWGGEAAKRPQGQGDHSCMQGEESCWSFCRSPPKGERRDRPKWKKSWRPVSCSRSSRWEDGELEMEMELSMQGRRRCCICCKRQGEK